MPATAGAVTSVAPANGATVNAGADFEYTLAPGETGASVWFSTSPQVDETGFATDPLYLGGGKSPFRSARALPPGTWYWLVKARPPAETTDANWVVGPVRKITVPRELSIVRGGLSRRGADVRGAYVFASNASRLTHRTEVYRDGRLIRWTQEVIGWGRPLYPSKPFRISTVLRSKSQKAGDPITPGTWTVRATVSDGRTTASRSATYVIR
ncbi:MAG: hypothetical protein AB7V42_07175 [Thermoleophilia bacterium]